MVPWLAVFILFFYFYFYFSYCSFQEMKMFMVLFIVNFNPTVYLNETI